MERISGVQLFALIVLFEIGSTTLFALGIEAKQDAWIAILIAMLIGFILLWIYTEIHKYYPEKNLADILTVVLGKWVAAPLIILYALFFFFISIMNLREFVELISLTILPTSPLVALVGSFMLVAVYVTSSGYEVLARIGEAILPGFLLFLVSTYVFTLFSGVVDPGQLQPVLGDGLKPVIRAAIPRVVTFPFGEMILFLMYWHYADSKCSVRKTTFYAVGISGSFLMVTLLMIVSVLGVQIASRATIPLYEVIKLIDVAEFITNLDAIGVVLMSVGGFFKMTLFFYGGVLMLKSLLKITNHKWLILLCAIFTSWFSIVYFPNLAFHRFIGKKAIVPYIHPIFEILCPSLMFLIILLKNKVEQQNSK